MRAIKERRKRKRRWVRFRKNILVAVLMVFAAYIVFTFARLHYQNYKENAVLAGQIETERQLEQTVLKLKRERSDLQDTEYIKDYARRKLFLMEKGEVPIRLIQPEDGNDSSTGKTPAGGAR